MRNVVLVLILSLFCVVYGVPFTGGLNGPCTATPIYGPYSETPVVAYGNSSNSEPNNSTSPICGNIDQTYNVWYTVESINKGHPIVVRCHSSDFQPVISAYNGDCNALTCLSHISSPVDYAILAFYPGVSGIGYVSVGGQGGANGAFELSITQNPNCC